MLLVALETVDTKELNLHDEPVDYSYIKLLVYNRAQIYHHGSFYVG